MPTLIAGVVAVIVLYLLLQMFRAANPAVLARTLKIVGGVVALAVAAFTGIKGELAVAVPLGIFGAGLLGWSPFGHPDSAPSAPCSAAPARDARRARHRRSAHNFSICGSITTAASSRARSSPGLMPAVSSTNSTCRNWRR